MQRRTCLLSAGLAVAALGLAGLAAGVSPALAQQQEPNEYQQVVLAQLEQIEVELGAEFRRVGDIHLGNLAQAKSEWVPVPLQEPIDRQYIIVGVCDQDCSDLDLFLYDHDGDAIERDVEPDAGPVVPVTPGAGAHQVRVDMVACSVEPCVYGLQLYEYLGDKASAVGKKLKKRDR